MEQLSSHMLPKCTEHTMEGFLQLGKDFIFSLLLLGILDPGKMGFLLLLFPMHYAAVMDSMLYHMLNNHKMYLHKNRVYPKNTFYFGSKIVQ